MSQSQSQSKSRNQWRCIESGKYYSGSNVKSILFVCYGSGEKAVEVLAENTGVNVWKIRLKTYLSSDKVDHELLEQNILIPYRSRASSYLRRVIEERLEAAIHE